MKKVVRVVKGIGSKIFSSCNVPVECLHRAKTVLGEIKVLVLGESRNGVKKHVFINKVLSIFDKNTCIVFSACFNKGCGGSEFV